MEISLRTKKRLINSACKVKIKNFKKYKGAVKNTTPLQSNKYDKLIISVAFNFSDMTGQTNDLTTISKFVVIPQIKNDRFSVG